MAAIALTVEFLSDGRCSVSVRSATLPRSDSDPAGSGFRCPLPYAAFGTKPVDLRVVLPSGVGRSDDVFPRLDWRQEGHDWVGTATLPAAPAFVSLRQSNTAFATGAAFGWNFYGFFVFAAAFIGVYFAWARWMHGRDRTRSHA